MSSGRVYVTRRIPAAGLERITAGGADAEVWPGAPDEVPSHHDLVAAVQQADVLLSLLTETIDAAVLRANPTLLGVSNYAVGYDNIDLQTATAEGIPVGNTPDVLTESTADLTWALLLATARRLVAADRYMRSGNYRRWGPQLLLGYDVSPGGDGRRKTLGVVGFGRIGRAVARRARGFDLEVLVCDPSHRREIDDEPGVRWADLERLLALADFVSLHVPLTPATHHLIAAPQLELMRPTAILVNTSRGPVIDEAALVAALREQRIGGAGLDVYENEPEMAAGLQQLDNVVLLPHIGSASRGTRDQMAIMAADNALAMLGGQPAPTCVNPEVYESARFGQRLASWAAVRGL